MPAFLVREIRKDDFEVAAELPQDLTAGAARRRGRVGVGDDRDSREGAVSFEVETGEGTSADRVIRGVAAVAAIWIAVGAWVYLRRRRRRSL